MFRVNLLWMAWRNLWRNRRRTLITLVGFAFGTMFAVLFIGLGDHTYGKAIDLAARMGQGHVTLQHQDYLERPQLKQSIHATDELMEVVSHHQPQVVQAAPRIAGAVMLATAGNSVGTGFVAVDPTVETNNTLAPLASLSDGRWLESSSDKGIVLGSKLAATLDAKLGHKVVYTLTSKDGEIVSGLARLVGIIKTGSADVDRSLCFLAIDQVRDLIGYESDEVSAVALFLAHHRQADTLAISLAQQVTRPITARSWRETMPDVAGFIAVDQGGNYVLQTIIMVLVCAGIFNSLFVSVIERQREFGVMLAIGFTPIQLFVLLVLESWWMSIAGLLAAALITAFPYALLSRYGLNMAGLMDEVSISGVGVDPHMYVQIHPDKLLMICGLIVFATLLAGIYPAIRAARVPPIDAIKLS